MKILVTGTAGFIGFHLAQRLIERGDEVVLWMRKDHERAADLQHLRSVEGDLGAVGDTRRSGNRSPGGDSSAGERLSAPGKRASGQ